MAKVFSSPVEFNIDYSLPWDQYASFENEYYERVREELRRMGHGAHKLFGKLISFPWADSSAIYMVLNATSLVHMPVGDAWQIPAAWIKGLTAKDIAARVY